MEKTIIKASEIYPTSNQVSLSIENAYYRVPIVTAVIDLVSEKGKPSLADLCSLFRSVSGKSPKACEELALSALDYEKCDEIRDILADESVSSIVVDRVQESSDERSHAEYGREDYFLHRYAMSRAFIAKLVSIVASEGGRASIKAVFCRNGERVEEEVAVIER